MNALGADVSLWNDDNSTAQQVNFEKAKAQGLDFVFIKSSQRTFADPDFIYNWNNAKRAGILRGAYHFLVWDKKGSSQADFCYGMLEKDMPELPIICDFEWYKEIPAKAFDFIYSFLERMKQHTDHPLGIYTAKSFWDQYGTKGVYWQQYILWLCDISGPVAVPQPWEQWDFWQYTFKGDGLRYGMESKDLDLNWYNGTLQEMCQRFGITRPEETTNTVYLPGVFG